MKLYRFDKSVSKEITAFNSTNFFMSRITRNEGNHIQIGCVHLSPGGRIGYHQATCPQLFLIVQGEGVLRTGEDEPVILKSGEAIYWEDGEWHETLTDRGLTAIIVEADKLDLQSMPELTKIP